MIDMINHHIVPSCDAAEMPTEEVKKGVAALQAGLAEVHGAADEHAKAAAARTLRLETMEGVRAVCDALEAEVPAELWTLGTYQELLFLDANQAGEILDVE